MKKNYLLSIIAVCTCLFTACNKEIDTPQTEGSEEKNEGVITYIRATGNENESKGSIDGDSGSFYWNEGDQIAVWNNGAYQSSIALSAEAGDIVGEKPANATFRFSGELNNRANFAVFPASIADGNHATSSDFCISLKGTYTLDEVAGEKSPVPMIAVNDGDNLHFKQLGALLRITLNNLPPSTKSVTIDFNGKKVWGSFPVASTVVPGSSNIVTAAATGDDAGKDVITINITGDHGWIDNQDVNIPVPTGTYTTITVKSWDKANGGGNCTLQMTRWIKVASGISSNWNPIRTSARKVIASLPAFSVDAEHRVAFAPGNLYKDNGTWKFFTEQYGSTFYNLEKTFNQEYYESQSWTVADTDISTEEKKAENNPKLLAASDWAQTKYSGLAVKDLFTWDELTTESTGVAGPTYGKVNTTIYGTVNVGSQNDRDGVLRSDWKLCPDYRYMMTSRDGAIYARALLMTKEGFPNYSFFGHNGDLNAVYQYEGKLGGTSGIFIFPDHWDVNLLTSSLQLGLNQSSAQSPSYTLYTWQTEDYIEEEIYTTKEPRTFLRTEKFYKLQSTEISKTVYDQLIAAGATFLPCSGMGSAGGNAGVTPRRIGELGGCWTSAKTSTTNAYYFQFLSRSVGTTMGNYSTSLSVRSTRLVRDIN